jgi:methionine salvage enolase-phosphatase E1
MKTQSENYHYLMREIASATTNDILITCERMVNLYCKQIADNDKAPMIKASLQGMITMREYQLDLDYATM